MEEHLFKLNENHLDSTSASQTDAMTTNQHRKTTNQCPSMLKTSVRTN